MAKAEKWKITVTEHNGKKTTYTRTTQREAEIFRRNQASRANVKEAFVIAPRAIIPKRKDLK